MQKPGWHHPGGEEQAQGTEHGAPRPCRDRDREPGNGTQQSRLNPSQQRSQGQSAGATDGGNLGAWSSGRQLPRVRLE